MYKIIGGDDHEYGPVSAEQLRQWIAEGRANAQTRVQSEGSTEWKTLRELPEFAGAFAGAPPPPYATRPIDSQALAADLAARDYQLDIGGCIGRGWDLFRNNMGMLIGGVAIVMLATIALAFIPFVGAIGQLIVMGPLTGGMYWMYIRAIRSESGGVSDAFAGFSRAFIQLMLGHIVKGLLAGLAVIPGAVCLGIGIAVHAHARLHGPGGIGVPILVVGAVLLACALPLVIYLTTCWYFTLPLIIDKQMGFWPAIGLSRAMVRKHWWSVFGLLFVSGLVAIAGILACGVGLLFTVPIAIGATMCAYEDIFGAPTPAQAA